MILTSSKDNPDSPITKIEIRELDFRKKSFWGVPVPEADPLSAEAF